MNWAEATQSPIVEVVCGQNVSFSPLEIGDYEPWCAELHAHRKAKSKGLIPAKSDPIDGFRMARMAEFDEPSLDAIAALVWTPAGAKKVLTLSLAKTVKDDDERQAIIRAIPPRRVVSLAVEVSGLFEKRIPPLQAAKGQPDPNAESESSDSPSDGATGS